MSRNTTVLTGVFLILLIGLGAVYYSTYKQLDEAATSMIEEAELTSTKIETLSLIPFSANIKIVYSIKNTLDIAIKINIDADLNYGTKTISHVTANDQLIQPSDTSEIALITSIDSSAFQALSQGTGQPWSTKGTMTITGYALGIIPVTITRTGDLFK